MEGEIGELLQSILSDPEQMGKITSMAQSLMGDKEESAAEETVPRQAAKGISDTKLLSALSGMLGGKGEQTRSSALLTAMRPYMRPEKQEKLDRAMQIARMVRVAGTVMKEMGGGVSGV